MSDPHFDLDSKATGAFDEVDPFNPGNTVRGFIHKSGKTTYGAMRITHVNGEEAEQNIWCTPKMSYPWDEHGFYKVGPEASIDVYEKLDGTNICGYTYMGKDGRVYIFIQDPPQALSGHG